MVPTKPPFLTIPLELVSSQRTGQNLSLLGWPHSLLLLPALLSQLLDVLFHMGIVLIFVCMEFVEEILNNISKQQSNTHPQLGIIFVEDGCPFGQKST